MQDEIDNARDLLDKMKEERQEEFLTSTSERTSRLERLKRSRQPYEKDHHSQETSHSQEDGDLYREGQQKRKQDYIVAELREKAEIISKSARKGPEEIASTLSRNNNVEDDPETAKYLQKIRDKSTDDQENKSTNHVEKSTVVVDFPSQAPRHKTSVTVKLNLDIQKSKIAVARGSGLQGRRKPTSEHIRRSLLLSDEEENDERTSGKGDGDSEGGMEADDEDEPATPSEVKCVEADFSESVAESKVMPQNNLEYGERMVLERRGSFDGLIPRTTPKPRKPAWKSKTYGGVALPAFAEAMKAGSKSLKKTDTAERLLTADVVKQAALDKLNRTAKEDLPEKEPEKPAWLVEAETRRKLHDRRRNASDKEKSRPNDPSGDQVIPVRLKKTGSKLLEEDIDKIQKEQENAVNDTQANKFVYKLKPASRGKSAQQVLEDEPTKISFKLRPTGIQLVEPEAPKPEEEYHGGPVKATFVNDYETEPPVASIRLKQVSKPEPVVHSLEDNDVSPLSYQLRQTPQKPQAQPGLYDHQMTSSSLKLRHIAPKTEPKSTRPHSNVPRPIITDFEAEPELLTKLRQRGKAPPINQDEEDSNVQMISRVIPSKDPTPRQQPQMIRVIQTSEQPQNRRESPIRVIPSSTQPQSVQEQQISRMIPAKHQPQRVIPSSPPQQQPQYSRVILSSQPAQYRQEPQVTRAITSQSAPQQYREDPQPYRVIPSSTPPQHTRQERQYSRDTSSQSRSQYREDPQPYRVIPSSTSTQYREEPQISRVIPSSRPSQFSQEPNYNQPQSPRTYVTPKPVKSSTINEYREPVAVTLQAKSLETARIMNQQPMRATPESAPIVHQPRPHSPKYSYRVTPIDSDRTRRASYGANSRQYSEPFNPTYSKPMSPSSVRSFSPPMSRSASVPLHVEPQRAPIGRSMLPLKANRGRRISAERSKTVAVSPSEVQRIIPGRRSSSVPRRPQPTSPAAPQISHRYSASEDGFQRRKSSSSRSEQDFYSRPLRSMSVSDKENDPQIVSQYEPRWMREVPDRRHSGYGSTDTADIMDYASQPDRMEAFERLERRSSKNVDIDDDVRETPSFMKEFERKRMLRSRGLQLWQHENSRTNSQSYA